MGSRVVRVDRPQPRLQSGVHGHARRQLGLLRALRGERQTLVQESSGRSRVRQSRHRESTSRSRPAARRSERRVHARRGRDRRGPDRERRESRGDHLDADALELHRQQRRAANQDEAVRVRLHRADWRAWREALLPAVVRDDRGGHGHAVRLSALQPDGRERFDSHLRSRASAVGERVCLR